MALANRALKDLIEKKALRPPEKREAVTYLVAEYKLLVQSSCHSIGLSCEAYYKTPIYAARDAEVIKALNDLIERLPR